MSENKKTFYITTPIYYPSGNMTIGHTYTTVAADTMTRFKKLQGYDTYFLTGTDEHGQKIEKKATEAGVTPIEYVDKIVAETKELWKLMDIKYDDFIRTTEERHMKIVQKIFRRFYEQGDIYKAEYEGMYCTDCESFWTPTQLVDKEGVKVCPDCGRVCQPMTEESYFFRMNAAMIAAFGEDIQTFIRQKGEKYYPDLKAINAYALRKAGVRQIEISEHCTWCESDRFWSHRVTKGDRGSQGAVITCKEGKA